MYCGEHAAFNVKKTPDGLELNLEKTYEETAGIRELKRCFTLGKEGLRLTDEIGLEKPQEITWVFLLRHQPVLEENRIRSGNLVIGFPEGMVFSAEEKPVTDARMARNWPGSLWRVKLQSKKTDRISAAFVFSAAKQEE